MEKIKKEHFFLITIYQSIDDVPIRLTKETKVFFFKLINILYPPTIKTFLALLQNNMFGAF